MKRDTHVRSNIKDIIFRTTLLLVLSLFLLGCGEAVSVGGIDTGGGGPNSLSLSWTAPTTNEDGTPLSDLAGYNLHYGTQPGQYSRVVNLGGGTNAEIGGLGSGTYYLSVTAYDIFGNESNFSNEIYYTFL